MMFNAEWISGENMEKHSVNKWIKKLGAILSEILNLEEDLVLDSNIVLS